jgi:hypothetical protein
MADARDLPLFAHAQALRRDRAYRRMLRRRGLAVALGVAALGLTIAVPPRPRLLWNASASAPIGLYRVGAITATAPGDLVVAWLPGPARRLAAERRYLPSNVPATAATRSWSTAGPSPAGSKPTGWAGRCRAGKGAIRCAPASCCSSIRPARRRSTGAISG